MNRKYLITTFAFVLLIPLIVSTTIPTASGVLSIYNYSDNISVGEEFEWKIKRFDWSGEYYSYYFAEYMYIGNVSLEEGDTIKLIITDDPDGALGSWFDVYVNNVKVANPVPFYIFPLQILYMFADFLISPISYTNSTGTYNIYEEIYANWDESSYYDYTTSFSTVTSDTTRIGDYDMGMSVSLRRNTFTMEMNGYRYSERITNTGNDDIEMMDYTIRNSININTGIVEEVRFDFEYEIYDEDDYVVDYDETGYFHFLMTSGSAFVIPFNWLYGIIGISILTAVMGLIRKKK